MLDFELRREFCREYGVYSDESCHTGHSNMVIGAVSASLSCVDAISEQVAAIRNFSRFPGDSLQWKNITGPKIGDYEKLVRLALWLIEEHRIDFTCLVVNRAELDHKLHNDGDAEVGFQKFLSEVYLTLIGKYGEPKSLHCYHGQRDSKFELEEIRGILNARAAKERRYNYLPFDKLEYRNPSLSYMHQLNDVLCGIISWHWNPSLRRKPDSPKSKIARLFASEIGYDLRHKSTPPWAPHIDVWKLRLK